MGEEEKRDMPPMECSPPAQKKSYNKLRDIARDLHERAVEYERLADYVQYAPINIDDAMFGVLCRSCVE